MSEGVRAPLSSTRASLSGHHHVRLREGEEEKDVFHFKSDFRRLGRMITGNAIGLVLGGALVNPFVRD